MNGFLRILIYGIQGFRRNIWLSVIAIVTMTLTITTITVFALANVVANKKYQEFNSRIDYTVFILDSASDADVTQLRSQLESQSQVASLTYLDKAAVLDRFNELFGGVDALKGVVSPESNPLPREIDIRFEDPGQIDQFHEFASQERFKNVIERSSYQDNKDLITSYVRLANFIRIFGLSFTIFFVMIAILVILNTIRLAIYARREEIEVMRLVGATRGYIRGPFLMEGILFGVIGALVSGILIWVTLMQLKQLLEASFSAQNTNFVTELFGSSLAGITTVDGFNSLFAQTFALQIAVGVVLGVICSSIAVRRYLKE